VKRLCALAAACSFGAFAQARPAAPPAPAARAQPGPVASGAPAAASSAASSAGSEDAPLVSLSTSVQAGQRRLTFKDRVTPQLAGYQSGLMGLGALWLEVFPAAGKRLPVVSQVGLYGSAARSLRAHDASASGGAGLDSLWHAWEVGGRYRGVVAGQEYYSITFGYGSTRWDFSGPPAPGALLPGGFLQYWRPGLELRLPLGPAAVALSGGYRIVVVRDQLLRTFPRASVAGADGALSVSVRLPRHLELRLTGRYLRFFSTLHPLPGDPFVAGGALDEYALVDLGLVLHV
jgi:hypothetical protein